MHTRAAGSGSCRLPLLVWLVVCLLISHVTAEPINASWRLQAFHLYQRGDTSASTTTTATTTNAVLLSDTDLVSETCTLDSVLESPSNRKSAPSPATTQSISLNMTKLVPIAPLPAKNTFAAATADATRGVSTVAGAEEATAAVESEASASVRHRDATPTQLRSVGVLHLGVFAAEVSGAYDADDTALLPLTDASDETEREYEVSVFVGDLSRHLCVSAAVYATADAVGNLSRAMAVWVPSSVSPACALRVSPFVAGALRLPLDEEDVLTVWPPTREQQCRLNEANKFTFRFKPAQGLAKVPSFCAYEDTPSKTSTLDASNRRLVRCEVFLDLRATTWYAASLYKNMDVASLRLAAAVSQTAVSETPASSNAVASRGGAASRWKGVTWCTSAQVGRGFWFSNASDCDATVREELSGVKGGVKSKSYVVLESVFVLLAAVATAGLSGVATFRLVGTPRPSTTGV
ncbi:hypothetical protein NESM_000144800 [Novymonas esmeraldas]|uniref:Uncharacterized protein n=1 Tax=Novymonas esmeraldas TaxID=1808958 RepID=A0AAW0F6V0_9TRYP